MRRSRASMTRTRGEWSSGGEGGRARRTERRRTRLESGDAPGKLVMPALSASRTRAFLRAGRKRFGSARPVKEEGEVREGERRDARSRVGAVPPPALHLAELHLCRMDAVCERTSSASAHERARARQTRGSDAPTCSFARRCSCCTLVGSAPELAAARRPATRVSQASRRACVHRRRTEVVREGKGERRGTSRTAKRARTYIEPAGDGEVSVKRSSHTSRGEEEAQQALARPRPSREPSH